MGAYRGVNDPAEVVAYIRAGLAAGNLIGADTETMGHDGSNVLAKATDRWHNKLVGFSLSNQWGEGIYVPIEHDDASINCPVTPDLYVALCDLLRSGLTCWHGAHFDSATICRWLGIRVTEFRYAHCTLLMAQCLGERAEAGTDAAGGLKPLAKKYLGVDRPSFNDLWPESVKKPKRRFAALDLDIAVPYAAADADDVLGLVQAFLPQLDHWQVASTYRMEQPLLNEVLWMEDRGCLVDIDYAERCSAALAGYVEQATKVIYDAIEKRIGRLPTVMIERTKKGEKVWVEEPLKLSSDPSLAAFLFGAPEQGGLGYPPLKMTAGGKTGANKKPSVDEDVLARLAIQEEWLGWLLEVRSADKVRGTYFDTFASYCVPEIIDGVERLVLHPNYKQFGAETGRTSSNMPNVQNLPKKQTVGAKKDGTWIIPGVAPVTVNTRDMFIPRPGFYYVDMDWSAIEYRLIAGFSQDPGLLETFRRGIDIHVATYALMYGIAPEKVDGKQRSEGKTMNYAINFGAGADRLAGMMGCTTEEAAAKMAAYDAGFPLVAAWKAMIEEGAKQNKYVQTLFGRKRWLNFGGAGISEKAARSAYFAALREAVNCPVQGTAADLLKITLLRLGPWLREHFAETIERPAVRTVLTTHDSITFEVPDSIDPAYFIPAVRPLVEFPENWQPGWPAITADFVHGTIGWGSLTEDGEDEDALPADAVPAPTGEPTADAAPVDTGLEPQPLGGPRRITLELFEDVTVAQVTALNTFIQTRPGHDQLLLMVPNDNGQLFTLDNIGITPDDRETIAELTGWVQFNLHYPQELLTEALAQGLA